MAVAPTRLNMSNLHVIKDVLTWTAPAIAIPGLRFFQDRQEHRNELFLRDASTYSIGSILFFATQYLSRKLMIRWNKPAALPAREFMAFLSALTVNLLYAGIGAVRFSQAYTDHFQKKSKAAPPMSQNFPTTLPTATHPSAATAFANPTPFPTHQTSPAVPASPQAQPASPSSTNGAPPSLWIANTAFRGTPPGFPHTGPYTSPDAGPNPFRSSSLSSKIQPARPSV